MKISADVWVMILALVAYGVGAVLGETKRVKAIVIGAGGILAGVALAVYMNLV